MALSVRNILKRISVGIGVFAALVFVVIVSLIAFCVVTQRGRTIAEVTQGDHVVRVIYYPGGLGTSNRLAVEATGGRRGTQQLFWSIGGDSAGIRFTDTSTVEVRTLNKTYTAPGKWYWETLDSTTFDLSSEIVTRRIGNPAAG